MPVTLKVEGDFSVISQDLIAYEQKVKFDMQSNESREILVSFNKDLIEDSADIGQSYHGKLRMFSLGKPQGVVNLQANIIHPTIEISDRELNIVNDMLPRAFTFKIFNNGLIDSTFSLNFDKSATTITKIQERRQEKLLNIVQCMMTQRCDLKQRFLMADPIEKEFEKEIEEDSRDLVKKATNDLHELHDIRLESREGASKAKPKTMAKSDRMKIAANDDAKLDIDEFLLLNDDQEVTVGEIHKYFKNLARGMSEVLCNREAPDEVVGIQKKEAKDSVLDMLKLSQIEGVLSSGESRLVSIYFKGSAEGDQSCNLEN